MDFRSQIVTWLAGQTGLKRDQIDAWIEIPPQPALGDYAFPCFRLAKHLRRAPVKIAEELAGMARGNIAQLADVQPVQGYLNFFVDRARFVQAATEHVLASGDGLGRQALGDGQTVVVEYSSPNIAKPFHVGHAFTTILGQAIYRLYDHLGYRTVRVNHLGDYGTQFGKLIVAYRLWGDEQAVTAYPIRELLRIYVRFHDEAKERPEL